MKKLLICLTLLIISGLYLPEVTYSGEAVSYKNALQLINSFNSAHSEIIITNQDDMASGVTPRMAKAIEAESELLVQYLVPT